LSIKFKKLRKFANLRAYLVQFVAHDLHHFQWSGRHCEGVLDVQSERGIIFSGRALFEKSQMVNNAHQVEQHGSLGFLGLLGELME
jgi:hypothetical protein